MEDRGADLLDGVVELRHHVAQPLHGSEIALTVATLCTMRPAAKSRWIT